MHMHTHTGIHRHVHTHPPPIHVHTHKRTHMHAYPPTHTRTHPHAHTHNTLSVTSNYICDGAFLTLLDDLFLHNMLLSPPGIEIIKLHLYWILYWVSTSMQSQMSLHCPLLAIVITLSSVLNFCVIILLIVSMCPNIYMDMEIMNVWNGLDYNEWTICLSVWQ